MKKSLWLISLFSVLCLFVSCSRASLEEFNSKIIAKIETTQTEGFTYVSSPTYKRTFDFEKGIVTDILEADSDLLNALKESYLKNPENFSNSASLEEYEQELNNTYNVSRKVKTFTKEAGEKFLNKIISLGIYTWKDQYITDDVIYDAAGVNFKIVFTDQTEKNTYMYFKEPLNYDKIEAAFLKYFSVGCWYNT